MDEKDKNKWIDEVMSSFDDMRRAEPDSFLFRRIENKLSSRVGIVRFIPASKVYLAAACLALLVVLNGLLLYNRKQPNRHNDIQEIATYYQLTEENSIYGL
jgi:hypothetical protein